MHGALTVISMPKYLKVAFFQKVLLLLWAGILIFKFRIVFWNIFFLEIWRFEKQIALSEKKPPLAATIYVRD